MKEHFKDSTTNRINIMITFGIGLVLGSYFSDEIKVAVTYVKLKLSKAFK